MVSQEENRQDDNKTLPGMAETGAAWLAGVGAVLVFYFASLNFALQQ